MRANLKSFYKKNPNQFTLFSRKSSSTEYMLLDNTEIITLFVFKMTCSLAVTLAWDFTVK